MKKDSRIRIVIDTNLWISFLIGRKLSSLQNLFLHDSLEVISCKELIEEIRIVASRPKFAKYFSKEQLALLWDFMLQDTTLYAIGEIPSRCRDPKDDYLLELASVSHANYLITGDKDLLELNKIGACQIVTVLEFETLVNSLGIQMELHEDIEDYYSIVIGEK